MTEALIGWIIAVLLGLAGILVTIGAARGWFSRETLAIGIDYDPAGAHWAARGHPEYLYDRLKGFLAVHIVNRSDRPTRINLVSFTVMRRSTLPGRVRLLGSTFFIFRGLVTRDTGEMMDDCAHFEYPIELAPGESVSLTMPVRDVYDAWRKISGPMRLVVSVSHTQAANSQRRDFTSEIELLFRRIF